MNWISVKDKLPNMFEQVIIFDAGMGEISMSFINGLDFWCGFNKDEDDISHWMPLPEPPKEE